MSGKAGHGFIALMTLFELQLGEDRLGLPWLQDEASCSTRRFSSSSPKKGALALRSIA